MNTNTQSAQAGPSDKEMQVVADRLLLNFGRVNGRELADAVAAHYPMDDETYWTIRQRVFAIADATNERAILAARGAT